jgi:hypothetical protein
MYAELLYDFEMEARRQSFLADPALVYDGEHNLFRFRDGWELLRKRGRLKGLDSTQ